MSESAVLDLLEIRAGGRALALEVDHVAQVLAASEWSPAPALALATIFGDANEAAVRPSRIVLVSDAGAVFPLAIDEVVGVSSVARADVLPLPALVRLGAPELAALAVRSGGSLLVLDPAALNARALAFERQR